MYQYFIALTRPILLSWNAQDGLASPLVLALTCTSLFRLLHLLRLFFPPTLPHFISHRIFTPPTFITNHPSISSFLLVAVPTSYYSVHNNRIVPFTDLGTSMSENFEKGSLPKPLSISHPHPHPRQCPCDNQTTILIKSSMAS